MTFKKFIKEKEEELPTASTESLEGELKKRTRDLNIFPLEVFSGKLKPLLDMIYMHKNLQRSYIGLSFLSAYSTAIGTAYVVRNAVGDIYLPVWACATGISSSGKSISFSIAYKPLNTIQKEFDKEHDENKVSEEERRFVKMKTTIFRDSHVPTLIRDVLPDNPKGVAKYSDELLEWINGMNGYSKKEGTDEQFWISSWSCSKYSAIRAGKNKTNLESPFVNLYGGIQPSVLWKLFKNDRATTGFIFRLLFASPTESTVCDPNTSFIIPQEFENIHEEAIRRLYFQLPVESMYEEPKICTVSEEADGVFKKWCTKKATKINTIPDIYEREIASSIYGKMKEYALRFAAILHLMDKAFEKDSFFEYKEVIDISTMKRALLLADYFYESAEQTYKYVDSKISAPPEVIQMANLFKNRLSYAQIAKILYGDEKHKQRAIRAVKKWSKEYPKQFGAEVN